MAPVINNFGTAVSFIKSLDWFDGFNYVPAICPSFLSSVTVQ
jgi:hypothetical protein